MKHLPRPGDRQPLLIATRHRKMAESAHAYVRGSTTRFYRWLDAADRPALPEGPDLWICGDCHVGNLGPVASAEGSLAIQLRDFDQTVRGNPAHDLIRLGLSLAMAARSSQLPGGITAHMLAHMVGGYEAAFDSALHGQTADAAIVMPRAARVVMREAAGRSWRHLADERIEGTAPRIPLGKRFWPLDDAEHAAIHDLFTQAPIRHLVTALRGRDDDAPVRVLDAAFWRKGCSSLGLLRLAALVAVGEGHSEKHCLVDIKEATTAACPHSRNADMPADQAERVVEGARALSPYLGSRMRPAHLLGKSVFVRELLPQDLKLELKTLSRDEAIEVATFLAHIVGRAHARQLDNAARIAWLDTLQADRGHDDTPSWLWNSVVDLVGTHESAYLEHCREHAMAE